MGRRQFPFMRRVKVVLGAMVFLGALVMPGATPAASAVGTVAAGGQARVLRPGPGGFVPITPFRVADTRIAADPAARRYNGTPNINWGETRSLLVANPADPTLPPGGTGAVTLTLTVLNAPAGGYVSLWPGDQPWPGTSSVNFTAGQVVSNSVTVRLDASGRLNLYSLVPVNVIIDVNGWYAAQPDTGPVAGGGFYGIRPLRLLDSRGPAETKPTNDGYRDIAIPVASELVHVGARAVSINLTITEPSTSGWAAIVPNGVWPPPVSHVNYSPGQTVSNEVIIELGRWNYVYIYVSGSAHVIADLTGYFTAGATIPGGYVPVSRGGIRVMDTRILQGNYSYDPAHDARLLIIGGSSGVPTSAGAAAVNITAVQPIVGGFVRAWPDSTPAPGVSNLSVDANGVAAVGLSVSLGPSLGVLIGSNAAPHLVVDLMGWYASSYV